MRLVQLPDSRGYSTPRQPRPKRRSFKLPFWSGVTMITLVGTVLYFRPLPPAEVAMTLPEAPVAAPAHLDWPETGQAALSAENYDFLVTDAAPAKVSTASMAKVITALCVLEKRPLKAGEDGPTITLSQKDVGYYESYVAEGGSVLPVSAGEKMTERDALEALLLPSANNIASTLVDWSFGSFTAYKSYATDFLARNNLTNTVIGSDASGFDPATVSTTEDLTRLAKLALKNPALMEIVGQKTAVFETAGTVQNTNVRVGQGVLTGLKTGHNEGNSGGFMYTARVRTAAGTDAVIVGSIVNDESSAAAVIDAERLALSAADDFETITYPTGSTVGTLTTAWGAKVPLVTEKDIHVTHWKPARAYYYDTLQTVNGTEKTPPGTLYLKTDGSLAQTPLRYTHNVPAPSAWWRLTHLR